MDVAFQETLQLHIMIYAHATALAYTAEPGQETSSAGTVHRPHPAALSTCLEACRVTLVLQATPAWTRAALAAAALAPGHSPLHLP